MHALFYFWAASSMLGYMLSDADVTRDELYAVGATFTLVAWAFAYVFSALQQVAPGSFTAAVDPDAPRTWMELLFLSFTNLSSTGLSDVVPIMPKARAVVMIEQLAGLAYVALFVSRVVGLTLNRRRMTQPEPPERPARSGSRKQLGETRDRTDDGDGGRPDAGGLAERGDVGDRPADGALTGQPGVGHGQRPGCRPAGPARPARR